MKPTSKHAMNSSRWIVMPEVAGELGKNTLINRDVHPPVVRRLHHVFAGWLGDDIIECFPCFLVTPALAQSIKQAGLTGAELEGVEISLSPEFEEMYPERRVPNFRWLKVVDTGRDADFSIDSSLRLEISDRCLRVLRGFRMEHATVIPTSAS